MPIQAQLQELHLQSPQPRALAEFYCRAYGLQARVSNGVYSCAAPGRRLKVSEGRANQLHYALFRISDPADWLSFLGHTALKASVALSGFRELPPHARGFCDPDGNCMVFIQASGSGEHEAGTLPDAVGQHFALRTHRLAEMLHFYETTLGFAMSDRVIDEQGQLRACFLRADDLHHTLALFGAPVCCFDHQSFETPSWNDLKTWADHMARERIEIVWGVGRHGPGNDVFFMVRDPDGNLVEISSEIEVCDPARPVGIWKHEERTLNLWGKAIMRG